MYKHLSRPKHHHQQSVDDFMKQIRKYNLKSERYLSPKPLLYMYSNPRNHTLHTIQREKSKTLSNRQSQSKKTAKNVRQKVQSILSIGKNKKLKSSQSFSKSQGKSKLNSQKNQKKFSTINDDQSQDSPMKNRYKIKTKINNKQSQINTNPGDLIEQYSKKLRKAQKYLQSKSKLGKMLCGRFLQMLNQIVDSMIKNLHASLDQLQKTIQEKVTKQMDNKYKRALKHSNQKYDKLQKKYKKLTARHLQILDKENYNNQLIYNMRKDNIDIDNIFGRTFLGTDKLGGRGYHKSILDDSELHDDRISQKQSSNLKEESSKELYEFISHPHKVIDSKSKKPQNNFANEQIQKQLKIKQPMYISKSDKKQNPLLKNYLYTEQEQEEQKQTKSNLKNQKKFQYKDKNMKSSQSSNQVKLIQLDREDQQIVRIQSSSSSNQQAMIFEDRIKPFVKNFKKQQDYIIKDQLKKVQKNNQKEKFIKKNEKTIKKSSQIQKNQSF